MAIEARGAVGHGLAAAKPDPAERFVQFVGIVAASISVGIHPFTRIQGESVLAVQPRIAVCVLVAFIGAKFSFSLVVEAIIIEVIVFLIGASISIQIRLMGTKEPLRASVIHV